MVPLLFAFFLIVVVFLSALRNGAIPLVASGLATVAAAAVLLGGLGPFRPLVESWPGEGAPGALLGWVIGAAVLAFVAVRIVAGLAMKFLFNVDSFLHPLIEGIPGGVLSLAGSLPVVFAVFLGLRWAGTAQELNYVNSLSQPGIEGAAKRFPAWPRLAVWRDDLEAFPGLGGALEWADPVAGVEKRHLAGLLMMKQSDYVASFLAGRADTAPLVEAEPVEEVFADPGIGDRLERNSRFGLLIDPALEDALRDHGDLRRELRRIDMRQLCRDLIGTIPGAESGDDPEFPEPGPAKRADSAASAMGAAAPVDGVGRPSPDPFHLEPSASHAP